jgi:hypothetical protein
VGRRSRGSAPGSRLETIDGLRAYDTAPETVVPPAVIIKPAPGQLIDYNTATGVDDLRFVLILVVPRRDEQAAQGELDSYLARTGPNSIYATVSGLAIPGTDFAEVMNASDYGGYTYANETFFGCKFLVAVGVEGAW